MRSVAHSFGSIPFVSSRAAAGVATSGATGGGASADAATAGAAAASHTKAEDMEEHSIFCDAASKDKACTIRNVKLTS